MSRENRFSDEFLNAFVDNELTTDEKSQAYLTMGQNPDLNRHVCELRKVSDLVRLAYRDVPTAAPAAIQRRRSGWPRVAAVCCLFLFGAILGWTLHSQLFMPDRNTVAVAAPLSAPVAIATATAAPRPAPVMAVASKAKDPMPLATPASPAEWKVVQLPPIKAGENRILVHVSRDSREYIEQALNEIESLLSHYRSTGQTARVEVVMNGNGLGMVRSDVAAFPERIAQIQNKYDNVTFAACLNTLERLKREQGVTARLLPGVVVIDSGVAQIMRRQNQGWAYIRV